MNKIVVLGGGTAGWITALFIQSNWSDLEISVIEDPSKPPIIAGESAGFPLGSIYQQINIDIDHWVKTVGATPKQGGIFYNWNGEGSLFYHALFTNYYTEWSKKFPTREERYFYFKSLIGNGIVPASITYNSYYCLQNNKVAFDNELKQLWPSMWHFDSRANAAYLKKLGQERGIKLIEGSFQEAKLDNLGYAKKILLDTQEVTFDWAFDCSGFARLLLEKTFKVNKHIYKDFFTARAVIAWWDEPCFNSGTIAYAMDAGWSWKIGIKERTGQGYLYNPDILTKDQALEEIHKKFGSHIQPVAAISFDPCVLEKNQVKNVIGIGLSTGFLEPLEANGVMIIIDALDEIKNYWNPYEYNQRNEDHFNQAMRKNYAGIIDFLALHYRGKGLDTDFWHYHRTSSNAVPESLSERLKNIENYFKGEALSLIPYLRQYSLESYITVIRGLDIIDNKLIKVDKTSDIVLKFLEKERTKQKKLVENTIDIHEWKNKFYH